MKNSMTNEIAEESQPIFEHSPQPVAEADAAEATSESVAPLADSPAAEKELSSGEISEKHASGAEAHIDSAGLIAVVKTPTYQPVSAPIPTPEPVAEEPAEDFAELLKASDNSAELQCHRHGEDARAAHEEDAGKEVCR